MRSSDVISAKRLVFLVGAPRSGTTWLQLMLARSQEVPTVNQTHLFSTYMRSLFDRDPVLRRDQGGAETLRAAFTWIGIGMSEEECREILHDTAIDKLRSGKINDTPWSLASEPKGFYRKGAVDSWKRELSAKQIFLVETITRDLMAEFGYQAEAAPSALHRAVYRGQHAVATWVRAGLEWRMRRMADRLSS